MRSGTATFAVGKPSSRPRSIAVLHRARAPRAGGRGSRPRARRHRAASSCARSRGRVRNAAVGRAFGLGRRDEPVAEHLEAELGAHALEQRDVAVAPVAEVEVVADHDEARAEHAREHLAHEVFGRLLAARLVEREHEAFVDGAGRVEQLELLVERREQLRRRAGAHDFGRMPVEGEHGRREAACVGEVVHDAQHRLVPEVHAVERADRDRAARRARRLPTSAGSRQMITTMTLRREHDGRLHAAAAAVRRPRAARRARRRRRTGRARRSRRAARAPRTSRRARPRAAARRRRRLRSRSRNARPRASARTLSGSASSSSMRVRFVETERADAQAPQLAEVRVAAERGAEIGRERAHVGSARTVDPNRGLRVRAAHEVLDHERVDAHVARRPLDRSPPPGRARRACCPRS